ncbi:MAG: DUF4783 domain-containing protein [Bacteroides sp.]|nr:DUF4783 domain-containing protein [Bacteroides sp.]MCI1681563.1 DUF4783 domain-containing protein [Bacteroides sp.]
MKKRIVLVLINLFFWISSLFAQDVPEGVIVAFKEGNSQELGQYLGNKVDLIIQSQPIAADKQKAEKEIAAFFADNKVCGFDVNHEGKRDESSFIIGTLSTQNGTFRVNCFFRKVRDKYTIHQIRIDKTNE